ncbi:glycosyltransferase family 4 protein [Bacteroides congonensis]|uniref:glycosyltransferase family 4 protein n=1 Tax=Bacteroides congonensis TaxID=1871006 RepID=UPI000935394A|nr:glycosyltransferase family 4 protein [Bacteroides congonensis]
MKKIAIFSPTVNAGGSEKQACLLAKCLSEQGCFVTFISFYGLESAEPKNIDILKSNSSIEIFIPTGSQYAKLKAVVRVFKERQIDSLFNYLTFCNVFGAIIGRICGVKKIYGGIRSSRLPFKKRVLERLIHNYLADYTIYNSYSGAKYFSEYGFNKKKNIVIHNCFENISPQISRKVKDMPTIISVGRFVEPKDYLTAIKSVKNLSQKNIPFRYVIVGYGKLETQIREWIKKYSLQDNVEIIIAPDNIPELLEKADVYLSTSIFEGTSNSLLEALNACLPIVATDVGDNKHIVHDGQNGYLHHIGDSNGIARSLVKLLSTPSLRTQLGDYGYQLLVDSFSKEKFTEKYMKLL